MPPLLPNNVSPRKRRVGSPGTRNDVPLLLRETTIPDPNLKNDGLKNDGLRNPAACIEPAKKISQKPGLLSLPCELLEMVALQLRRSQHILNLTLANKQISGIVQDILARDLVLSRKNVKLFLELLAKKPELINKITSADLGDFGCIHHEKCLCLGQPNFSPNILRFFGTAITSDTQHTVNWSQIRKAKRKQGPMWRKNQAFFLDVLISLCPNIKAVTVELPEARIFGSPNPSRSTNLVPHPLPALNPELPPVAPFQGTALQVLQHKLESLTIAEDSRWKGPATLEFLEPQNKFWRNMGKFTITLPGFSRLERMDVPMEVLGHPQNMIFSEPSNATADSDDAINVTQTPKNIRSRVLPLTLKHLHLRSCSQFTFAFLQRINEIPVESLQLKHIEMFFRPCTQAFIIKCETADDGHLNYLRLLSDLKQKGVKVGFYTGAREEPVDMWEELSALSALSTFEVYSFPTLGSSFSKLNIMASKKRRSHFTGSRLFVRYASHHLQLFNRPTFDTRVWSQNAFFHGTENTKWDPKILDRKAKVQSIDSSSWSDRPNGKRESRARLPTLLNLDRFEFAFRTEQDVEKPISSPKEVSFFGVAVHIPENFGGLPISATCTPPGYGKTLPRCFSTRLAGSRRHPKAVVPHGKSDDKKTSLPENEDTSLPDQGHWTERQRVKKVQEKSLEHVMDRLQLGSDPDTIVDKVAFTKGSRFDSAAWTGVKWGLILSQEQVRAR